MAKHDGLLVVVTEDCVIGCFVDRLFYSIERKATISRCYLLKLFCSCSHVYVCGRVFKASFQLKQTVILELAVTEVVGYPGIP